MSCELDEIEEGDSYFFDATFTDEDGELVTPNSAIYRIDDEKSGDKIKDDTAISITGSTEEIEVLPAENAIINPLRSYEIKVATVTMTYNTTRKKSEKFRWKVLKL